MHSVPSAKGEPRPTTLRDARKLGLLPSVTNVLGVINKPELVEWKMTQAVLAALTLPRLDGEGEDAFANGVKFFSTADVVDLSRDRAWLVKMTNGVCQHWQRQNVKRKSRSVTVPPSGSSAVQALSAAA